MAATLKRKREEPKEATNTDLVREVFGAEEVADLDPPPWGTRADGREPRVGDIVVFSEGTFASEFTPEAGNWNAMLIDKFSSKGAARGYRVVRSSATFMVRSRGQFFLTEERLSARRCAVLDPQPTLEFVVRKGQTRIERVGTPKPAHRPDTSVGARVVLPAGTWPDDALLRQRAERREKGRRDWEARCADPERFPYVKHRSPENGVSGEHDGTPCACLVIVASPGVGRKMLRGPGERELLWTEELVPFDADRALANFGGEFWWANGPQPKPAPDPEAPPIQVGLRTLDIFAGCGGLIQGLQQSGLCKDTWAVEMYKEACDSYEANYPESVVFREDCNQILRRVMRGKIKSKKGKTLPLKGEVEAIVGGPPCQGFSHMNRFRKSDKYEYRNSLVSTFLSFCDWYRPKLFMMENVPNFGCMNQGAVLQRTVETLLKMKYQVTFRVVQAGNYGAPQSRRRFVIVAVPHDARLPSFPTPTHTFTVRKSESVVKCGEKRFIFGSGASWAHPPRTIRDAIGDLNTEDGTYSSEPTCDYQRWMRVGGAADERPPHHDRRVLNAINEARFTRLPVDSLGVDWRDLPDEETALSDGTKAHKLVTDEEGLVHGRIQKLTIVPWSAVHTGKRYQWWPGMYGRLQWDGHFPTTVTRVSPTMKQGTVIHPEKARIVSVRECARSQGFPDAYALCGTTMHKYIQIGNAVPIPLAKALGRGFAPFFQPQQQQ